MADFCKQCSIEVFGEDFGDLRGLGSPNVIYSTICEGCGPTIVRFDGSCTGKCVLKREAHSVPIKD